jgi:hypothetical protein
MAARAQAGRAAGRAAASDGDTHSTVCSTIGCRMPCSRTLWTRDRALRSWRGLVRIASDARHGDLPHWRSRSAQIGGQLGRGGALRRRSRHGSAGFIDAVRASLAMLPNRARPWRARSGQGARTMVAGTAGRDGLRGGCCAARPFVDGPSRWRRTSRSTSSRARARSAMVRMTRPARAPGSTRPGRSDRRQGWRPRGRNCSHCSGMTTRLRRSGR